MFYSLLKICDETKNEMGDTSMNDVAFVVANNIIECEHASE